MSNEQQTPSNEANQEEIPSYPFPFADHSLDLPKEYDQLRQQCPVARVHMPYGGDAFLPTTYQLIGQAFADPRCGTVKASDGDLPRLEAGAITGTEEGSEMGEIFTVSAARHTKLRRVLTSAFSVAAANYDSSVFPDAREIRFDRDMQPILSFGRGVHACLGQQIARMELQILWHTLLTRLPNVRLAVPPSEVPWRENDSLTFGPEHLPVTW